MLTWQVIRNLQELAAFEKQLDLTRPIAVDTETYKTRPSQPNARLLGIAVSGYRLQSQELISAYIVINHYNRLSQQFELFTSPQSKMSFLQGQLVGWNVPFDKLWLDSATGLNTKWKADGRILWHLQNNDVAIRGFGLKLAQKKLLGWEVSNDDALERHVKMFGGSLSNGDHYLSDLDLLARYACLDTASTLMVFEHLSEFMDHYEYWWFADELLDYAIRLYAAGVQGLPVSEVDLLKAFALYNYKRDEASNGLRHMCEQEITAIEDIWKVKKLATLKSPSGRHKFVTSPSRWQKFNPASGQQRALLMHTMLEFPVLEKTPTGMPKTDRANLSSLPHKASKYLVEYSEYKKVAEQAQTYYKHVVDGRMYTSYDVCGTVSGRLSGFSPSVLNMPFSEPDVMKAFTCEEGYTGVHADLTAIEPCVLAHYSEDPGLLKVYKEGRGDIYLDLGLEIFKEREDLRREYDPEAPPKSEIKSKFKDLRSVCKIIHLAISYTGTHITISKNLSKSGYPTSRGKAMQLVSAYWNKFGRVKAFNSRLQEIYEVKGHLRNIVGRVVRVPREYQKDLMNRLIQSSAHDILRLWVMEIIKEFEECGVEWKYWLPDLHDSTTFMVKKGHELRAQEAYTKALKVVEANLGLSVPLKCEMKFCTTLAGIKDGD